MAEQRIITGGINLEADQISIGGDVVARDKIVNNITAIYQRALTATEETEQAKSIEAQQLKQGVIGFLQRLRDRTSDVSDTVKGGPYKGLLEYRLSDAEIFFGRTQAIAVLGEHLQRGPLTILHAESGAGKTSLLQAGMSPHLLQHGHLPIYLRPYQTSPLLAIKRAFLPNLNDTPHLAESSLRDFLTRVSGVLGSQTTLFIFLDQFEEFFTQLEEKVRAAFVEELVECRDDVSLNVRWVFALRTEFFGNLADFRPRIQDPFENDYRLNRLTRVEAYEAIASPAAQRNITFEDGLIDTLLDHLGKEEVAPPQVQLVCSALYEALPPDTKVITRQLYDDLHGTEGILHEHLSRVLKRDIPPDQRSIAQHLLEALITSDVHRVLRPRVELANEITLRDVRPEALDQVLTQLVDSRLLRVEDVDGQPSFELAHDYLLNEIKLDPAVQARKAAQELLEQEVHAYQRYGTLLSDDKFAIIAPRRSELAMSDDAWTLFQRSERALRQRQRLVFGGIGLVIALIVLGAISIFTAVGANVSAGEAHILQATSEAAASLAQRLQATSEAGAVIAVTREAIANETLRKSFEQTGIVPVGNEPIAFAFDGTRLWVANSNDGTVQSINATTGQVGTPIWVHVLPTALAFDGTRLWVASRLGKEVVSVDPTTDQVGTPIKVGTPIVDTGIPIPINRGPAPSALAFDGTRLWVTNSTADNTVQSIDPTTGQVGTPIAVGAFPAALAFDGTRLWVVNRDDKTVQSINPTTGQVGMPIAVGNYPSALAFDGTRLWVANSGDNTVQPIDPTTNQVGTPITVGAKPTALAFDGTRLWVANSGDNTVQPIDPTIDNVVSDTISTGRIPMALIPVVDHLWIANYRDNTIQQVDLMPGDVTSPISVGAGPVALALDGTLLWVYNQSEGTVQSVNPTTGKVDTPIKVSVVGPTPAALIFDGTQLWVTNFGDSTVLSIDPTTSKVGTPIKVGAFPNVLAFDALRTRLWVGNLGGTVRPIDPVTRKVGAPIKVGADTSVLALDGIRLWAGNHDTVRPIDPTTGNVGAPIKVGNRPSALAFDGMQLWVANYDDNTVQSIDPTTGNVGAPIKVGRGPTALAFDTLRARLWVANYGDSTVQYIVIHK